MKLKQRVDLLESVSMAFTGYAVLFRRDRQTVADALADWEAGNGPVGDRVRVVLNFGCER